MIMKIGGHNFARAAKRARKRDENELKLQPKGIPMGSLPYIDPIVLPLIVAMGTSNTATKRDQHEMEINLN